MQATPSNDARSAPFASLPTTAQVHRSQLLDYELLLSALRGEVGSLSQFSQTLLKPRAFSPLDQENETGQGALQELIKDPDYQALCRSKNVSPFYLVVTLKEETFVYETSNREDANKTELTLTGNQKWQALRARIEKSVPLLGGQIRYDRLVSVPRMATFYGMRPWDPTNTIKHQGAIDTLREKIASYKLGLEEDFNILDLKPDLAQRFRSVSFQNSLPPDSQDEMHNQFMTGEIKRVIQTFLPDGVTSPLTHLANDILVSAMPEKVRAQPTVFLKRILQSPEARKLGEHLLATMDWYGGKSGEESSPHIRAKVVANALQIWFTSQIIEYPDRIAGYDLQSSSNWGISYQAIWRDFENHLLTSKRASSEKEAIVMARLFLGHFPAEFRITDIPENLPYKSSVVWVNFVNGVNLVNITAPETLHRKTFQQLVNLPLNNSDSATEEQLYEVSLARLLPTIDWAVAQGITPQKQYEEYSQAEVEQAVSELDKYTSDLNDALIELNKVAPDRLSIAKNLVDNYLHVSKLDNPLNNSFWNDHKLAIIPLGARLNPQEYVIEKYSVVDVVAEDKLGRPWSIFTNNGLITEYSITLDESRKVQVDGSLFVIKGGPLPDAKEIFEQKFKTHIAALTSAYKTLIKSLFTSLPFSDRQALELGDLNVYTLRKETYRVEAKRETPELILPHRARNGLLLVTTYEGVIRTFELLPRAGIIRRIDNLAADQFGGILKYENWPIGTNSNSVEVLRPQTLAFDWTAHSTGSMPRNEASCEAIIEQLGHTFMAPANSMANSLTLTINSNRCLEICDFIATQLLFIDPKALRAHAYGTTKFDSDDASQKRIEAAIKFFIPFWKSIDDITSDDVERKVNGAFGLSMDVASFALPIGRFASGSAKLISNAGGLIVRARLTAFATLTKEVSILALQSLSPLDLVGKLLKALGSRTLKLSRFVIFKVKSMANKAGRYNFVQSLPQIENAGRWRPLESGDVLATVRGIDDVPVRNLSSTGKADFRLVDPLSSQPYGPSLSPASSELSLGRSHYITLEKNSSHVIVEVAENTRVRNVLEVDGRTTVFLDDVPYRLDGDTLRRVSSLDASEQLKQIPCRIRRAGDEICKTSYVLTEAAERPKPGTIIEEKCWAPWFGDGTFYPSTSKSANDRSLLAYEGKIYEYINGKLNTYKGRPEWIGLKTKTPVPKETVSASLEFQTGIYGSIKVTGTADKIDDLHIVGAIIVPSIDEKTRYIFTRLNIDNYYSASISSGDSILAPLTMKRLSSGELIDGTVGEELIRVYAGSLNANNTVRIHGREKLEDALEKIHEIAIPIGTPKNPSHNMKHLKVDTGPAEALLFDKRTRLMVAELPDGATVWTPSVRAPEDLKRSTEATIDALFSNPAASSSSRTNVVTIDQAMEELQKLLPRRQFSERLKNIAFAEVKTTAGQTEVYVSVSGAGDSTRHLPLFKSSNGQPIVNLDGTTYFNVDSLKAPANPAALHLSDDGKLLAIPHPIDNASQVDQINWATSVDSESKLVGFINEKYPYPEDIKSITVVTTLPPCDSCSIILKEFGHERGAEALNVIWGKRPNVRKRPHDESSRSSSSST